MEEIHIKEKKHTKSKKHSKTKKIFPELFLAILGAAVLLVIFGTQYATGEFGFSAVVQKDAIAPTDSVLVSFSHSMAAAAVQNNFEITPEAEVDLSWTNKYRKLEIKPKNFFQPGETYSLRIDPITKFSFSSLIGKRREPKILLFRIDDLPKVVSMTPASGDPNVKIDSPLEISFDKPTTGYDINFVVDPFSNFDIAYDGSRQNFTITPKAKFDYARDYAVSVKIAPAAANLTESKMFEAYRANFKTEPSPPPPPDPVEEVVLPEDKIAGIVADSQVVTTEAKIKDGKYIDINLAKQHLSMFEDGERLGTYKVSTGKKGMATPTGTFHVTAKRGRAWSKKYNLYMPYFMQFTGAGHGIHELPEWKSGYKEGANHLGTPVSHGCVRLGVGPAAKVYDWSEIGTPIVVHY